MNGTTRWGGIPSTSGGTNTLGFVAMGRPQSANPQGAANKYQTQGRPANASGSSRKIAGSLHAGTIRYVYGHAYSQTRGGDEGVL